MGAFATQQIEIAINLLNFIILENEIKKDKEYNSDVKLLEKYRQKLVTLGYWQKNEKRDNLAEQEHLSKLIEIIGEPIIKQKLNQMYSDAFTINNIQEKNDVKNNIKKLMRAFDIKPTDLQ